MNNPSIYTWRCGTLAAQLGQGGIAIIPALSNEVIPFPFQSESSIQGAPTKTVL